MRLSRTVKLYQILLATTGLCAPGVFAHAEEGRSASAGASAANITLDEVTVTGQTLADTRAIATKRKSDRIQDSVSSDEVGKLPDFNAGDAIKRIAGVNVLNYQGEPRFVTIRGFSADYNTTLVDGFHMASPDPDGRKIYMEVLPSNLASRIDVVKSFTPDLDGQALGGNIDFISHSAFDYEKDDTLILNGKGGGYLQEKKIGGTTPTGEFDVIAAKKFGFDHQFGLLVSGSFWSRRNLIPQNESGGNDLWFNSSGKQVLDKNNQPLPGGGNGITVPQERRWYLYDDKRQRQGGSVRFDWKPAANFTNTITSYYYGQSEKANRNETTASANTSATNPNAATNTTVLNQTATSGTLTNETQTVQLGRLRFRRDVEGVNDTVDFEPIDKLKFDLKLGWTAANSYNPQTWDNFAQKGLSLDYNTAGTYELFTPSNASNYYNSSKYGLVYHRIEQQDVHEHDYESKLNVGYNVDPENRGLGVKFGGSFLQTNRNQSFVRTSYSGAPYTLADVGGSSSVCPLGCSSSTGGLFLINPSSADALFNQYKNSETATVDLASQYGGTYSLQENIGAGYSQLQFASDKLRILGGLRYEATNFQSHGYQLVNNAYVGASNTNNYGNVLPALTVSYDVTPDFKARFAYSETVGRGKFSDLAIHSGILSTTGSLTTLAQGNSNLKPLESNNFDLTGEYYLDGGKGILSAGVFYKAIKNEIFTFGQTQTMNVSGVPTSVLVTQAQNGTNPAKVGGVEFNFIKNFDFLPNPFDGLGIIANGTLLKTKFPITLADGSVVNSRGLPQQADKSFNVTLFYEQGAYHARLALNYTGTLWDDRFSNLTNAVQFYRNRYQAPMAQINFQLGYDITKNFKVTLDAFNITGAGQHDYIGYGQNTLQASVGLAPAVLLGAGYTW